MRKSIFVLPIITPDEPCAYIHIMKDAFFNKTHLCQGDFYPISKDDLLINGKFDDESYELLKDFIVDGNLDKKRLVTEDDFAVQYLIDCKITRLILQKTYN